MDKCTNTDLNPKDERPTGERQSNIADFYRMPQFDKSRVAYSLLAFSRNVNKTNHQSPRPEFAHTRFVRTTRDLKLSPPSWAIPFPKASPYQRSVHKIPNYVFSKRFFPHGYRKFVRIYRQSDCWSDHRRAEPQARPLVRQTLAFLFTPVHPVLLVNIRHVLGASQILSR